MTIHGRTPIVNVSDEPKAEEPPKEIRLLLRPQTTVRWAGIPWDSRLAQLLKVALRRFGFRVELLPDPKPEEMK